ncbi:MAG TPA: M48 family metalloprotease [Steroidobacteraceae bacterium]|nr:M48 family metalloprotease [Steroidobacteraceae bacterium]
MTTQFFERQDTQRSLTRWLVVGFVLAFLLVTVVINLVVIVGLIGDPRHVLRQHPEYVAWISLVVIGTMLIASWHKSSQLRAGGAVIARSLGGVPVTAAETDLKRKRLLNIVEEMAIAARIRKPQVYVLPEEPGINAFAAGHSPDEAAVAVTQGALDRLDREQLQAVIGHEFSHILNGDMRINMRLTAWIFGLFVVTDLATRLMRSRGRGKGAARLKIIALGIFIAGSVGLLAGRLLQAAVSRRREHLADASAVQFTRNPQALQGAFVTMAASAEGSQLQHENSTNVAHMFFAGTTPSWAHKIGTAWFSTHPSLEERVRALDTRITSVRFRTMVSDERRRIAAQAAHSAGESGADGAQKSPATASAQELTPAMQTPSDAAPLMMAAPLEPAPPRGTPLTGSAAGEGGGSDAATPDAPSANTMTVSRLALAETLPSGVRMIGGRALPPDVLRNRLSQEQQFSVNQALAQLEKSKLAVQGVYVAAMLAAEPAKWRAQLIKLAPLLGVELMKETQAQVARMTALAPAARLPLLSDLLGVLDTLDPADRKRLRALARAFAPTVAAGDMLRFAVTRVLEKRLAKAADLPAPVPLPEQAPAVCELYAALAQCRFGAGKQGQNAYRAGLMGMLTPQKWSPYPEAVLGPAALDTALAAVSQVHPTGKRSFSEGMARVIAVGGRLTVPQVDLLRAICLIVDCPVPVLPVDVVFDENALPGMAPQHGAAAQASAR